VSVLAAAVVPPAARRLVAAGLAVALVFGLALVVALSAVALPASLVGGSGPPRVVVLHDAAGTQLARVELAPAGHFALAYRNSLHRAPAEERFAAFADGSFRLVQIAADRLAVLEEYYGRNPSLDRGASGGLRWEHTLATPPAFRELRVLADRLGRRTLVVGARRIELWRLVGDGAVVRLTLEAEEG
jgi:hypothetical protein